MGKERKGRGIELEVMCRMEERIFILIVDSC